MNEQKLFDAFQNNKGGSHQLYSDVREIIMSEIINARGVESAKFYETLRVLSNSENNAGWESRHSDRIKIINDNMSEIAADYESYLP